MNPKQKAKLNWFDRYTINEIVIYRTLDSLDYKKRFLIESMNPLNFILFMIGVFSLRYKGLLEAKK